MNLIDLEPLSHDLPTLAEILGRKEWPVYITETALNWMIERSPAAFEFDLTDVLQLWNAIYLATGCDNVPLAADGSNVLHIKSYSYAAPGLDSYLVWLLHLESESFCTSTSTAT